MIGLRLLAGTITLAGATLLMTPSTAEATMRLPINDPFRTRFCCGSDTNGDGKPESYCCYTGGCSAGPQGCLRSS